MIHAQSLSLVQLFAIPWTVACQAPLSMRFFRSGLPLPPLRNLQEPGAEPTAPMAPVLAGIFLITEPQRSLCPILLFFLSFYFFELFLIFQHLFLIFQHHKILQNGSSRIFLAPNLELAIFPRISGSFCWRMVFKTKVLSLNKNYLEF